VHFIETLEEYLALGVKNILIVGQIPTWDGKDGLPGKISRDFIKKKYLYPKGLMRELVNIARYG